MGIKIIDKSKINFIIGGICECYYNLKDVGIAAGVHNDRECMQTCCEEGLSAYAYKFTSQVEKQQDALLRTCPGQMKNTQIEVFRFFGCALAVGMFGSLFSILK